MSLRPFDPPDRVLRARSILLAPGLELSPGEIEWDRAGRIVALRRARGPVTDLCILPGLVDAHTHLQLEPLAAGSVPDTPQAREFVPWARAVIGARASRARSELESATRTAAKARLAEGVTAVGEIDSVGCSAAALRPTGIGGRCYRELTGYHLSGRDAAELVAGRQAQTSRARGLGSGLSPHAPYSVSAALFRSASRASRYLAIHCAETAAEQEFLRSGSGPFADLLRELGRLPAGAAPAGVGAVAWLERLGLLRPATQLVHCQELEPGDTERIARSGASIVVCPGTIEWFGRAAPPVPEWLAAGIPVGLGTDSAASTDDWSLHAALVAGARLWPELAPEQLFRMATVHGGRALGQRCGRLRIGGRADWLAVPAGSGRARNAVEALVGGASAVLGVWARGCRVAVGPAVEPLA